ncbi:MAG: hypothetical protein HFE62_02020 [Firmicutes bacterium]|nr:hypothetical protein [Bacillota bacterium]
MKKFLPVILCVAMAFGILSGCGKTQDNSSENSSSEASENDISIDEIGLSYKIPDEWNEFKETNIYPLTVRDDNSFAEIVYGYINDEGIEKLNNNPSINTYSVITPICEILLAKTSVINEGKLDETINFFKNSENVGVQGEYSYYLLWDSTIAEKDLSGKDIENYNKIVGTIPKLKESISTRSFDDKTLEERTNELNSYITFVTSTLEGAPVDSSIFASYDLTMVHFGGTYTYPDFDEFATLQKTYEMVNAERLPVNIIEAVIDAPSEETNEKALKAKEDAKANDILTIVMDQTLGSWVQANLEAIPATVFVDSDGHIVGETMRGTHDAEKYLNTIQERLNTLNGIETPVDENSSSDSEDDKKKKVDFTIE